MHSAVCRFLDRLAFRTACLSVRAGRGGEAQGEKAREWLREPTYFDPPVAVPVIRWRGGGRFTFDSRVRTDWPENNRVYGRVYRAQGAGLDRPTVLLLHGWNGEMIYATQFPWVAWRLGRRGLNTVTVELPYHGRRRPRRGGVALNFVSGDLGQMVEAVHQSLADIRAVERWLRSEGAPAVAVWGISLGAWLAGLAVRETNRFAAAVLMTPLVDMERALAELPFFGATRESLARDPVGMEAFNLAAHPPGLESSKILVVAGRHDLFAPQATVERLAQAWGHPEVWSLPHGHISALLSWPVWKRTMTWLSRQLPGNNP